MLCVLWKIINCSTVERKFLSLRHHCLREMLGRGVTLAVLCCARFIDYAIYWHCCHGSAAAVLGEMLKCLLVQQTVVWRINDRFYRSSGTAVANIGRQ